MFEEITKPTVLEKNDYQRENFDDSDVQMNEFEFTADLAIELPLEVEPEKFFGYLNEGHDCTYRGLWWLYGRG